MADVSSGGSEELVDLSGLIESPETPSKSSESDSSGGSSETSEVVDPLDEMLNQAAKELGASDSDSESESQDEEEELVTKGEDETEEEEEEPKKASEPQKESRAQKRIKQLSAKNKELQGQLEKTAAEMQAKFEQQTKALQQQIWQEQQRQNQAMQQAQLEYQRTLQQLNQVKAEAEEKNLDPAQRWERQLQRKILSEAEQIASKQTSALQEELENFKLAQQHAIEEQNKQKRYQKYREMTSEATNKVLFEKIDPELRQDLIGPAQELLLTYSTAFGEMPDVAASKFAKFLENYQTAVLKTRAKKNGAVLTKNSKEVKATPKAVAAGEGWKPGKNGTPTPTKELLEHNGYRGKLAYFDWASEGRKPLRPLPR